MFLAGVLAAALGVGVIGVLMELVLLRRIYACPSCSSCSPPSAWCWPCRTWCSRSGARSISWGRARRGSRGAVDILGHRFPAYELFLIAMGPLVLGLLWLLMHKTRFGVLVRAATQDREMVGALGVNQALLFTGTLFLGAALAGPRRRAADAQARRQPAHGHLGDRRGLRRHGGGRHGLGAGRLPGGAADRRAAGVRHPGLPQDHAGAGVPADGAGAGGAALGPDGPARGRPGARGAARGHRAARSASAGAEHIWSPLAVVDAAGAAARRRRLSRSRWRSRCCASRSPPSA